MIRIVFFGKLEQELERFVQWYGLAALQVGLSIIYIWFGALKLFNYDPIAPIQKVAFYDVVNLATFAPLIGILEVATGLALLLPILRLPRWLENTSVRIAYLLLSFQLLTTIVLGFFLPSRLFAPYFPYVSVVGELLFRNFVFALSGLVVAGHLRRPILEPKAPVKTSS